MNQQLLNLWKNDTSTNKPKLIKRGGKFTKTFLKWNKKELKAGRTIHYAEPGKVYSTKTGRVRNLTTKLKKEFNVTQGVASLKSNTKYFSFIKDSGTNNIAGTEYTTDLNLNNNLLLKYLIDDNNISGSYRLIIKNGNQMIIDTEALIDSSYVADNSFLFQVSSTFMIWNNPDTILPNDKVEFIFSKEFILPYNYFEQRFLDGLNHCFFHPITQHFQNVYDNSKSKDCKRNCMSAINKINGKTLKTGEKKIGLIEKYKSGIPESEIAQVCESLNIGVDISQPFTSKTHYQYRPDKKPKKVFKFINTRLNHIEKSETQTACDSIFKTNDPIEVTRKELNEIKKKLDETKELCIYKKNVHGIHKIQTLTNVYMLNQPFYKAIKEFEKETGLNECSFDRVKEPELASFVDGGTHFNGTIDFQNTDKYRNNENIPSDMKHIDMTKAYTQFNSYSGYEGFLGKITDFRECNEIKEIGLYYIIDVDFSKCDKKFISLIDSTKWIKSYNVYPSPELKLFQSYGVSFKVTHAAFGIKKDFSFTDTMINEKDEIEIGDKIIKVPYYSKWTGFISMKRSYTSFYMNGDERFFKAINPDNEFSIMMTDNKEARVHYPVKYSFTKKHITAFITSYQRCIMLQQLMKMNIDKVVRICCDGIYYKDHKFNMLKSFTFKSDMTFKNSPADEYLSNILYNENEIVLPKAKPRDFFMRELFKGAGGNGKTYYNIFLDTGLVNKVYVAHSNKLNTGKVNEYYKKFNKKLSVSLHNRLLSGSYQKYDTTMYSNYIIDECSMIDEEEKKAMFENCKGKIIMCGDIGYQLPPIHGKEMNEEGFDNVIELPKNYRFKDEETLTFMNKFRTYIEEKKSLNYMDLGLQIITKEELKSKYKKEDMILAVTNKQNDQFTKMFSHIKKYKVTENRREFKNGDIVYKKPNQPCELRHGYTIHSVQGEDYEGNIYIAQMCNHYCMNKLFYTAISRTRSLSQIYIIKN